MGDLAVSQDDRMEGSDMLMVMVPAGTTEVPTSLPCRFEGSVSGGLSDTVCIGGKPAAMEGSTAKVRHTPPEGTRFQNQPNDDGTIRSGSKSVNINGRPAARSGDLALTRNATLEGRVIPRGTGTVRIGK